MQVYLQYKYCDQDRWTAPHTAAKDMFHWGSRGMLLWEWEHKSRKENPQKLTQWSSRFHPRHLVGKRTAQEDTTIDITSDSQVNSNFQYRWSPASLTFYNYFYLFLYLYIIQQYNDQDRYVNEFVPPRTWTLPCSVWCITLKNGHKLLLSLSDQLDNVWNSRKK